MSIIYEPKGKALEYSPLAVNLYQGCEHACSYCYAPSATFTDRNKFSSKQFIKPRKNILTLLEKDAIKFKGDKRTILLSFTSDPYQPIEEKLKLTRQSIRILNAYNLTTNILTKGGLLPTRDFDLLSQNPNNTFSVTLTTDDENESKLWEPFAALPKDRIEGLKIAHKMGIKTWVSFEPVINTRAVFNLIDKTHEFVDLYKIGKINHHPHEKTINWHRFLIACETKLKLLNKPFYIKKDLEHYRSNTKAK